MTTSPLVPSLSPRSSVCAEILWHAKETPAGKECKVKFSKGNYVASTSVDPDLKMIQRVFEDFLLYLSKDTSKGDVFIEIDKGSKNPSYMTYRILSLTEMLPTVESKEDFPPTHYPS